MATRPIFCPKDGTVHTVEINFEWHAGMATSQKKKSIASLHKAANKNGLDNILEISTKSEEKLGRDLSAFNLKISISNGENCFLERIRHKRKNLLQAPVQRVRRGLSGPTELVLGMSIDNKKV